ncbi:MAG TPA: pyruvate kinase, partial [Planctomycetota bacterium]|nr:pyruvate kinase [Planctomycetota bacterium]
RVMLPTQYAGLASEVEPGHRVLINDGAIRMLAVDRAGERELRCQVLHGGVASSHKGINLPDSDLDLPALTSKDLEDLDVVLEHADLVGLSFVERVEDVEALEREIAKRTSRPVGIILKIETRRAFAELPSLLLAALRIERVGVMIARGDLAVECGFERLADLQEEILALCGAAHVPVIWATQVLEKLSKKGMPSRAEISDAALGARAECVMLNKGPYVVEAVRMLEDIFGRTERRLSEKMPVLCRLPVSKGVDSNDRDGVALAERGARRGAAVAFALENALLTDDEPAPPTR